MLSDPLRSRWRRREASGDMIIVRYADDFIVGFQHEAEAQCFLDAMRERLQEFALSLHPEKTRRFAVTQPRWEPYAGKPHVRFCAGGAQQ